MSVPDLSTSLTASSGVVVTVEHVAASIVVRPDVHQNSKYHDSSFAETTGLHKKERHSPNCRSTSNICLEVWHIVAAAVIVVVVVVAAAFVVDAAVVIVVIVSKILI